MPSTVLSVDLDVFVRPTAYFKDDRARLANSEYHVWDAEAVERFLEVQCGLSRVRPRKGARIVHHDEILAVVAAQILEGGLTPPFRLDHLDAHSDLGLGDVGWTDVLQRLVHLPVEQRLGQARKVTPGNWLSYMLAYRWLEGVRHARQDYHKNGGRLALNDIHPYFVVGEGADHVDLQLVPLREDEPQADSAQDLLRELITLGSQRAAEPRVRMELVPLEQFQTSDVDFVVLCHSPGFTPPKADILLEVIGSYLDV